MWRITLTVVPLIVEDRDTDLDLLLLAGDSPVGHFIKLADTVAVGARHWYVLIGVHFGI